MQSVLNWLAEIMVDQTTVVLGAGGPTGRQCVKQLVDDGIKVRAVVRNPDRYKGAFPDDPKVEVVKGDVTDEDSVRHCLDKAKRVIFTASARGYFDPRRVDNEAVGKVAEIANELGMERVVLCSSVYTTKKNGLHPFRLLLNVIRWRVMDHKFEGEEKLRNSGVPYTVVRPACLTNEGRGKAKILLRQGDEATGLTTGMVSRSDTAAVCCAALKSKKARNRTFELESEKTGDFPVLDEQLKTVFDDLVEGMDQ